MFTLLLLACSGDPEPPGQDELAPSLFHEIGSHQPLRLVEHLASAEIVLPASNLVLVGDSMGDIPLDGRWRKIRGERNEHPTWAHDNPIRLKRKSYSTQPEGVSLFEADSALPFGNLPGTGRGPLWDIGREEVRLLSANSPEDWNSPPVLRSDRERELQERINFATAGLSAEEFVPYTLTLGAITRPGLLIPAPGSIRWELDLPLGARLELSVGLVQRTLTSAPASDGAALVVELDGEELAQIAIEDDGEFTSRTLDLSRAQGQRATLVLRTLTRGSPDYDHVFVGTPQVHGIPQGTPRRVVIVGIDTLRRDGMTQHGYFRDTTSPLQSLAESSLLFENALAPAPRTRPSFRTSLTGRYPLAAMDAETLGETLHRAGFQTGGITANVHLVPRFGFSDGYDYWHYDNGADADVQLGRAKTFLDAHAEEDTLLFVHLMDPHTFYRAPGRFKNRYVETDAGPLDASMNRWRVVEMGKRGDLTEDNRAWLRARYDGEVRYMSEELASFVAWLDTLPGETLLVIHTDHGEEFWEHGSYEHNHTLYGELVNTVLWIRPPTGWTAGPQRIEDPVGLVDIVPTVLDMVGVPLRDRPPTDGISLAPLLDASRSGELEALGEALNARAQPVGHLMYDKERWAVVSQGHKYILQTANGDEELYDLRQDPGERSDLHEERTEDLDEFRLALSQATGWPVGAGWRINLRQVNGPFTLRFEGRAQGLVMDPESASPRRANLEWGASARVLPEDIGTLSASDSGQALTFQPGTNPRGTLLVLLPERGAAGRLEVGEEGVEIPAAGGIVRVADTRIRVTPGTVILPQDSVRERMQDSGPEDAVTPEAMDALQALGYVE